MKTAAAIRSKGFSLVELAIALIVIGVLLGGLLKGRELIGNSQIIATVTQIKSIDAAISTFRDKYDALPGDITNPGVRLPGCAAQALCNVGGNGDRVIVVNTDEVRYLFPHLAAAGVVSEYSIDGTRGIPYAGGPAFYPAKTGRNGIFIAATRSAGTAFNSCPGEAMVGIDYMKSGIYIYLGGLFCAPTLSAVEAFQIDTKMDDGVPGSGLVRAAGENAGAATACGSATDYNSNPDIITCHLYIRIQQ
jgi:prepilin-type N-terminal cleavage/methylation domain-containing protein